MFRTLCKTLAIALGLTIGLVTAGNPQDGDKTIRIGLQPAPLAIVRALVERLGGTVGVRSVPGSGSMFWVELPLPRCEGAALDTPSA